MGTGEQKNKNAAQHEHWTPWVLHCIPGSCPSLATRYAYVVGQHIDTPANMPAAHEASRATTMSARPTGRRHHVEAIELAHPSLLPISGLSHTPSSCTRGLVQDAGEYVAAGPEGSVIMSGGDFGDFSLAKLDASGNLSWHWTVRIYVAVPFPPSMGDVSGIRS